MKAVFMTGDEKNLAGVYKTVREKLTAELDFISPITSAAQLEERKEELRDVGVIFSTWGMLSLDEETIRKYFVNLRAVFYAAGSVQYFARPFLSRGVRVFSAWAANAVPVVEFTIAEIILANKGYYQRLRRNSDPEWSNRSSGGYFTGNFGNKVGLIGVGMIGSMVAERLKDYRLEVLAYDPFLPVEKAERLGVTMAPLKTIFSECTVISNHLANNPQTVGMLNGGFFDLMRPNAAFINTGRGAQVVEKDLIKALKDEPARVALLDVTYPEPPAPDSELRRLDNVFLTQHIAGSLGEETARMGEYMYEEFGRYMRGEPAKWEVTMKMLETMA